MKKYIFVVLAGGLLSMVSFFGCGGEKLPDGMPPLFPYEITITQEKTPLEGASVYLVSDAVPYVIAGKTDASGLATMKTQDYTGVPAGDYKVTVSKVETTPSQYGETPPESEAAEGETPEEAQMKTMKEWENQRRHEYRPTHSYVDAKYETPESSELTLTVSKSGSANFDVGPAVDDLTFPEDSSSTP